MDDYQLHPYSYSDDQSLSGMSVKPFYHHLEQDINPQTLNVSSAIYHLTTVDPHAQILTSDPLEEQAYYQTRAGALIHSPMMYHPPNQHYSNCSPTLISHLASTPSQCMSARQGNGPQAADSFEACLVSRHQGFVQTSLPLGKSPPSRYIKGKAGSCMEPGGLPPSQIRSARGNHDERPPERIMVKQENINYAYLEDGEYYLYTVLQEVSLIRINLPSFLCKLKQPTFLCSSSIKTVKTPKVIVLHRNLMFAGQIKR